MCMVTSPAFVPAGRPRRALAGVLACLSLACAACKDTPAAPLSDETVAEAAAAITADAVGAHVAWLADDERLGRRTPGPGLAASAAYIAGVFRDAGLRPGGDGGTFLQRFGCAGLTGDARPANVVAYRRGSDSRLASEWIVVTAHYDGLVEARFERRPLFHPRADGHLARGGASA